MPSKCNLPTRLSWTAAVAAAALWVAPPTVANTRVPLNYGARQMTTPVVIDGRLDEWRGLRPILLMREANWEAACDGETYRGAVDAAVRFYVAWDAINLYLAIEAYDDDLSPPPDPAKMMEGDCIVLALDTRDDASQGYRDDDVEFAFAYARSGACVWRGFPSDLVGPFYQAKVAVVREIKPGALETGVPPIKLTYEVAVPWADLPGIVLEPGTTFGFDLLEHDVDAGRRHGWLQWTPGLMGIKDPSRFGNVHLAGPLASVSHRSSPEAVPHSAPAERE